MLINGRLKLDGRRHENHQIIVIAFQLMIRIAHFLISLNSQLAAPTSPVACVRFGIQWSGRTRARSRVESYEKSRVALYRTMEI